MKRSLMLKIDVNTDAFREDMCTELERICAQMVDNIGRGKVMSATYDSKGEFVGAWRLEKKDGVR